MRLKMKFTPAKENEGYGKEKGYWVNDGTDKEEEDSLDDESEDHCSKIGHNSPRCTKYIIDEQGGASQANASRARRPKHCSICQQSGHTKTTCAQR